MLIEHNIWHPPLLLLLRSLSLWPLLSLNTPVRPASGQGLHVEGPLPFLFEKSFSHPSRLTSSATSFVRTSIIASSPKWPLQPWALPLFQHLFHAHCPDVCFLPFDGSVVHLCTQWNRSVQRASFPLLALTSCASAGKSFNHSDPQLLCFGFFF